MTGEKALPKRNREEYLKVRDDLHKTLVSECESFDKAIMQLGVGAIGVSLAFLDKIAKPPVECRWLLGLAWSTLAISLIINISSFLLSHKVIKLRIDNLDNEQHDKPQKPIPKSTVRQLNISSASFLIFGVIFLLSFCFFNLNTPPAVAGNATPLPANALNAAPQTKPGSMNAVNAPPQKTGKGD